MSNPLRPALYARHSPQPLTGALRRVLRSSPAQAMAWPHGMDRYLEAVNPLWSVSEVRARIVRVEHPTADSVTLTLKPNGNWRGFVPGQFVRLGVSVDGVRRSRCYSPANSAHCAGGEVELTIKAHADGYVSRYLKDHAESGMVVDLSPADGSFRLPGNVGQRPAHVLLISGGSGITPVMSMLRTLCDEAFGGRVTFLHYANSARDMAYLRELESIAARHSNVRLVRRYADSNDAELTGRFCREHLAAAVPDYADAQTFLCGPPPLMDAVHQVWEQDGIEDQLHLEQFTPAAPVVDLSEPAEGELRFAHSERLAVNDGRSILEQAEATGLQPEFGCRMGICHSCTCRKTGGRVRSLLTGVVSSDEEEDIQICVSAPEGSVTLDL